MPSLVIYISQSSEVATRSNPSSRGKCTGTGHQMQEAGVFACYSRGWSYRAAALRGSMFMESWNGRLIAIVISH